MNVTVAILLQESRRADTAFHKMAESYQFFGTLLTPLNT